jgi:flagellar protein FliO/FliZ
MLRSRHLPYFFLACLATGAAHAQTASPSLAQGGTGIFQLLAGLVLVVGLIFGSLWLLKRLSSPRGATAGLLRVLAGTAVGPRERVVLVEIGDEWLILGVAPGSVSALHRLPRQNLAAPPTEKEALAKDFGTRLRGILERKNAAG